MNTNLIASLLLPAALSTSLFAQDLKMQTVMGPHAMAASIGGAADGSLVILVLGLHEAPTKLPDGQVLGVAPDLLVGFAVADRGGATLYTRIAAEVDAFAFYVQAVAIAPKLPLNERGTIQLSPVQRVESVVPSTGRNPSLPR